MTSQPNTKPKNPNFSSGPCAKPKGWSLDLLKDAPLGRSHRSKIGKAKLQQAIEETKELLQLPKDYRVAVVPASDTGAVEMAMWSMLGCKPVDVFAWESFSSDWVTDITKQLKLKNANVYTADYGQLPDLSKANPNHDIVFAWNGTTSGTRVPNADWIASDREGIVICDATSAIFAMEMDWSKLDVITYSWQKVLGGEAAHGMLILSPRAVERLESYTPDRPLPKLFRMTKKGKLDEALFEGATINTPSMLCVEDYLQALKWAKSLGGQNALIKKAEDNAQTLFNWVNKTYWIDFLCEDAANRSVTGVCLKIVDPVFLAQSADIQEKICKTLVSTLEKENVAYDFAAYRTAPAGLRIWCGSTVEKSDIEALCPWLEWAWDEAKKLMQQAA
jgi:phosphoserine aminotransferase